MEPVYRFHARECREKCPTHGRQECQLDRRNRGVYYCKSAEKVGEDDWRQRMDPLNDLYRVCFFIGVYSTDKRKKATEKLPYHYRISYAKKKKKLNNKKEKQKVHEEIEHRLKKLGFDVESPEQHLATLAAAASVVGVSSQNERESSSDT